MKRSLFVWTCDRCHTQRDTNDQPRDWTSIATYSQPESTNPIRRHHLCQICTQQFHVWLHELEEAGLI